MADELVMPRLSDTMERGTIARWVVKEGDAFQNGDVLAEIETDKALMELSAYDDGVLLKILVPDGAEAELGAPIAVTGEAGEEVPAEMLAAAPAAAPTEAATPAGDGPAAAAAVSAANATAASEVRASPIARKLASENGIDLRVLAGKGSGPEGRIVKIDVEKLIGKVGAEGIAPQTAAPKGPTPAPAKPVPAALADETRIEKPSSMLKAIAQRMGESNGPIPHFYVESQIDMEKALELRKDLNTALEGEVKISVTDMIIRASALALLEHPEVHRSWVAEGLAYHSHANVGVAVALDEGLIVPVIRHADDKSLVDIAKASQDLAERARAGRLLQDEIEGGTFTVSNLGMFGVTRFMAIINPPEPAILAVGATVDTPVVRDGEVVVRPIMTVTLSCDHRATSGAGGAALLQSFKKRLEQPVLLLA
ncbi:MAG: dihydrolipoamide acetyltransferase family protein [Actinobacteria bacterium]|nr:dihydrolipoamide acetyltransferase family protein [Actinomycetota bacterium]